MPTAMLHPSPAHPASGKGAPTTPQAQTPEYPIRRRVMTAR